MGTFSSIVTGLRWKIDGDYADSLDGRYIVRPNYRGSSRAQDFSAFFVPGTGQPRVTLASMVTKTAAKRACEEHAQAQRPAAPTRNFNMALSPDDVAVLWEAIAQYRENMAEAAEQYEDDAALARKLRVAEALEAQFDALHARA